MALPDPPAAAALPPPAPAPGVARLAASAGSATMASRLLGLVREQVLAAIFGAGNAMDAFLVAFRIPNLVRDLFAEGAMSAAFVPTFTRHLTRQGRASAWRLANMVITALLLITGLVVVLGIVFARPLVTAFAADFALEPGKLELTVTLTRVMLPFLPLVAVAAATMGMLNSLHRFFIPALSPAMFNVAIIACALVLVPLMPALGQPAIMAIAIGAVVGGVAQAALQWPSLRREGYRFRPALDFRDEGLLRVLILMGPGTVGLAATQVNLFVNTVLATSEGTGAVSWLNYAFRLMYLPIGLFGVSIATAALPSLSRDAARDQLAGMRQTISAGLRLMLMLNVPAAIGLIVLASPIVQLIFERGRFTPDDTAATAAALLFYAPGLIGYSTVKIAVPSFYSLHDARTPVVTSVATVALAVVLNVVLVKAIGYRGLALGTAIAALFNAVVLLWLLRKRLGGLDESRLAIAFVKILAAGTLMGAAAWGCEHYLRSAWPPAGPASQAVQLFTAIASGLVTLAVTAKTFRISEFDQAIQLVAARVARTRPRG